MLPRASSGSPPSTGTSSRRSAPTRPSPTRPFEQVARNLAPDGGFSLRIGGDSTDWTWFPIPGMKQPPWVRWTMTPVWAAVTKRLVADLHAHLIVGLNMESDSIKIADAELHEIQIRRRRCSAPITFELGNEPELYSHFPFYHDAQRRGGARPPEDLFARRHDRAVGSDGQRAAAGAARRTRVTRDWTRCRT